MKTWKTFIRHHLLAVFVALYPACFYVLMDKEFIGHHTFTENLLVLITSYLFIISGILMLIYLKDTER